MPTTALTYSPASSSCLHSGGGERMTADEGRLRVSESRAKRVFALPNRWSSESHQACLRSTSGRLLPTGRKNGRVVTEVGVANGSCFNRARALIAYRRDARRLNNANRANRWSSESKAMLASALPSRDGGRLYVKIMAETFGHSWTSQATKVESNNFATLSHFFALLTPRLHKIPEKKCTFAREL